MPTLATVTFRSSTGVARDSVVHDWTIDDLDKDDPGPDHAAVIDAIGNFYNDPIPAISGTNIAGHMSQVIDRGLQAQVRLYDISDDLFGTPHGSPYSAANFPLDGAVGTPLPSELASVLTLEAVGRDEAPVEVGVTRPKQRFTGRVFMGPLTSICVETIAGRTFVSTDFRLLCTQAANRLDQELNAIGALYDLGVWSRADGMVRTVEAASMDNAFDVQRKRGEDATNRTRFVFVEA